MNGVKAHYETLTQTARVEECSTAGEACPLVPHCYNTKCIQKNIYHRLHLNIVLYLTLTSDIIFPGFSSTIRMITTSPSLLRLSNSHHPVLVIMDLMKMLIRYY